MSQSNEVTTTNSSLSEDLDVAWNRAVSAQQELVNAQARLEDAEQEVCLADSELLRVRGMVFERWYSENPEGFLAELSAAVPDPARVQHLQKLGLVNTVVTPAGTTEYAWGGMAGWFKRALEKM